MYALTALLTLAFADETPAEKIASELPEKAGELRSVEGVTTYDDPRAGASRRYVGANDTKLDLYVYDLGVKNIAEGTEDATVKDGFTSARSHIKIYADRGVYRNLKLLSEEPREVSVGPKKTVKLLSASYRFDLKRPTDDEATPSVSHLMVTGMRGQVVKVRITHPDDETDRSEQIDAAVAALIKAIDSGR